MDPRVAVIPGLVLQGIILSWINKLEKKCECSADWRREFIKYYSIVVIVYGLAGVAKLQPKNLPVLIIFGLAALVNLGSILSYIPDLKKKQCNCAIEDDWRDNFIFWWSIVGLILTALAAFMLTSK